MKSIRVLTAVVLLFVSASCFAQTVQKETIKVWGNCGSCKKHIETAALAAGANVADWNKTSKMLVVSYDPAKASDVSIQKSIAAAGYDTEKFKADDKAYKNLDECCQYDRKKITAAK